MSVTSDIQCIEFTFHLMIVFRSVMHYPNIMESVIVFYLFC